MILLLFETHCYKFARQCYKQPDGGPIGLCVTNCMAKIIIAKWIIVVMKYLDDNEVKVHIVKSYVDDIRWLLERIASGVIWCNIT